MRSTRGFRVGSVRGVPLILTPGWALIGIILIVIFAPTVSRVLNVGIVPAAAISAGVPVLLALSVLLHELAHGLTAQACGVHVREYVLSLWGGHTAFQSEIRSPGVSALVSVVGPATNAVLAAGFWLAGQAAPGGAATLILYAVAVTNVFVAAFNALPALPMDGGRLLEALIWRVNGDRDSGTLVAARVGQVVAVLVAVGSLAYSTQTQRWSSGIWGVLIGWTLWRGATSTVKMARARRAVRTVDLNAWSMPVVVLRAHESIAHLAQRVPAGSIALIAESDGRPRAWVDPRAVQSVPASEWDRTSLSTVAAVLPQEALISAHRGADAVAQLAKAAQAGARYVVLVGLDGHALAAVDVIDAGRRLPRR
ncbi:MAG: site-2 protease family protein [Beutenbergiaceae bacterium]